MNFFNRFSSIIYFRYNYLLTLIRLSAIILLEIAQKAVVPLVSDEITQQKGAPRHVTFSVADHFIRMPHHFK